jgi:hypothetical protein
MSDITTQDSSEVTLPNGSAAAAILSAGFGCFVLGLLTCLGDISKPISKSLNFYNPTGPLSGVTTVAIVIWLASWIVLALLWGKKSVALAKINLAAFVLLALGILLTFPPFADLLMGK